MWLTRSWARWRRWFSSAAFGQKGPGKERGERRLNDGDRDTGKAPAADLGHTPRRAQDRPRQKDEVDSQRAVKHQRYDPVRAGAKGFILKSAPFDQLRQAIEDTSRGIFYLDPSVSLVSDEAPAEELSEREKEVLILTAQGLPSSETARLLSITKRTVAAHLTSIYAKLGAKNKTEAILLALKRGVILLDQLHLIDS